MEVTRVCRICGEEKVIEDFYKHPQMAGGRDTKCKKCQIRISKETKFNNLEYYREWKKRYNKVYNVSEKHINQVRAHRLKNPDQWFAVSQLNYAVECGKIIKKDACENCGIKAKRLHGHHDDYSKPLEVKWLCSLCHQNWHVNNKPKRMEGYG